MRMSSWDDADAGGEHPAPTTATYKQFAGSFLTGVAVLTVRCGAIDVGCTVTSIASVSAVPPRMLVCLSSDSGTLAALRASGTMALSMLGAGQEAEQAADVFSRRGYKHLGQLPCSRTPAGMVIATGSVAVAELRVVEEYVVEDHCIVIGEPRWLRIWDERAPLAHWRSTYRSPESWSPDQVTESRTPTPGGPSRTPQILVVADDLTGANSTAAGFSKGGLRAVTVGSKRSPSFSLDVLGGFDVVVVNTDTRHASEAVAAEAVSRVIREAWPVALVSKRMDTTLRGNVGVEAQAALRTVAKASGHRVAGLCLPAHPLAGRVTVNGSQLLHGRHLENTELNRDPRSPVHTSRVDRVLAHGTRLHTVNVGLAVVASDNGMVGDALRAALDDGADVVIGDSLTEQHLMRLAEAAVYLAAEDGDLVWVALDSGPGSVALARAMGLYDVSRAAPLLAISGSATSLTRAQLRRLSVDRRVVSVSPIPARAGRPVPDVPATAAVVVKAVEAAAGADVVLLATAREEEDVIVLEPGEGAALASAMGDIARRVLDECVVDGLFTTGGDVTSATLERLHGQGLEVTDEVVPLAVSGVVVGGPWSGLPLVTKGGLVGDVDTTLDCLNHLSEMAEHRRRSVRSADSSVTTTVVAAPSPKEKS